MYRINVNHDSCHQINLSITGNACLINETEGRPRVPCISISTVLVTGFIPLAVFFLQIIFTIFCNFPSWPTSHPFIIPSYRPLISRLLYPSNLLILRAAPSLSLFSRSSFSRSSFSRSLFSRPRGGTAIYGLYRYVPP